MQALCGDAQEQEEAGEQIKGGEEEACHALQEKEQADEVRPALSKKQRMHAATGFRETAIRLSRRKLKGDAQMIDVVDRPTPACRSVLASAWLLEVEIGKAQRGFFTSPMGRGRRAISTF